MARYRERLDPAAMDALVARFAATALAAARQILGDEARAEDAVQETFLHLVRNPRAYDPARPFTHWFYAVLRNACHDLARRHARHDALLQRAADRAPGAGVVRPADSPDVPSMLASLDPDERSVLRLRLGDGLDFDEIAVVLGISREAAKKRAQRGLRRLRERFPTLVRS
jgi:RNA polymerase sigma-70 factor (ECF subfamily)